MALTIIGSTHFGHREIFQGCWIETNVGVVFASQCHERDDDES